MSDANHELPIEALAVFPPPGLAVPHSFQFSHDDVYLFYLAVADGNNQQLYAMNVATGERALAVIPPDGGVQEDNLSLEEELRRQRARMLEVGITYFEYNEQSNRLLIPLSGDIYMQEGLNAPLRPVVRGAGAITPTFSPDGTKIAYVSDDEIYVVSAEGGDPQQITFDARGTGKTNGLAEYIAQEELGRSQGFWWSPDSQFIVYAQVDETHIPIYRIMHQGKDWVGDLAQEDHRYPFAGQENAIVRLAVVSASGGEPLWLDLDVGYEYYVARVFWWKDGTPGAQLLNRLQNQVDLVRFDLQTGARSLILRESSEYWINRRTRGFVLLSDNRFIWASERSGFNHLYLYDVGGQRVGQLTDGEWLVDDVLAIDERNGVVYFTGTKDSPLEKQLYNVPLTGGEIRNVTLEPGTHDIKLNHACTQFVDTFHSLEIPPTVTLCATADNSVVHIIYTPNDPRLEAFQLEPPELVSLENRDGTVLYGAIYRPDKSFGNGPYPTIIHVYGGPGPQMVANSWRMTSALQLQYLRQQGYLVFRLDNRGSARRGLAFEGAIKHQMGTVEVDDQIDGVRWLVSEGLTDPARIGVTGWSYGGYMSLLCLLKAPELFKVAVAGAPVTHYDGYDTAYTERYMNTPQDNPEGYREGSVLAHVERLRGKLLIIHGLIDENVHFRHTARLMNALNRARKRYDVLIFPDERHSPRRLDDRTYMQERIVGYFLENL